MEFCHFDFLLSLRIIFRTCSILSFVAVDGHLLCTNEFSTLHNFHRMLVSLICFFIHNGFTICFTLISLMAIFEAKYKICYFVHCSGIQWEIFLTVTMSHERYRNTQLCYWWRGNKSLAYYDIMSAANYKTIISLSWLLF